MFYALLVFFKNGLLFLQEVLAYKLSSSRPYRFHKSSSTPADTDLLAASLSDLRTQDHLHGDSYQATIPIAVQASRLGKSQENLSASVNSSTYSPLSTSKDTVIASQLFPPFTPRSSPAHSAGRDSGCRLLWQRGFPCPVMGINKLDIMGDGMEDLVIVTLKGLHILQV